MKRKAVAAGRTSSPEPTTGAELVAPYDAAHTKRSTRSSKKMTSNGAKAATAKRKSSRATKKNRWNDEDFVTTSDKSPLIGIDLAKLLAKPEAWTCLDEAEKKEILALLPESVHPLHEPSAENSDETIPPLSEEFLRYSNVWRDATRQFQVDLESGKFDPQWLDQAHKAMEERAEGKFDARKERDFEAFWGQKQRYHTRVPAGDSATVTLKTLIANGVFEAGDIWKYSRAEGKGGERILIEKEAAIVSIDGESLTFALPPGRRVILSLVTTDQLLAHSKPEPKAEPETEPGHETDPKESLAKEIADSVSPEPRIYEGEKQSVAHEYIENNNQRGLSAQFITELNDIAASEDTKPTAETSMPILGDMNNGPGAPSPMGVAAPEATPPDPEPDTIEKLNTKPTSGTSIPISTHETSAPNTHSPMDIDIPEIAPPNLESDPIEKLDAADIQMSIRNPVVEDSDDDGCSILSDPPAVIEEIEDLDFYKSLEELGSAPPKDVPAVRSDTTARFSKTQTATQPAEPGMTVVEIPPVGPLDTTIAAQPVEPDPEVPNDISTGSPNAQTTPQLEPIPPGIANDANAIANDASACPPDAQTAPEITPPATEIPDETNACPSDNQTTAQLKVYTVPEAPDPSMGDDVGVRSSDTPIDVQSPQPDSMPLGQPGTLSPNNQTSVPTESNGENLVILPEVTGPMGLARKIYELDGRGNASRIANAWMSFRCTRNNQDMGTLWEIRHSWYVRSKR
ncbi:hypothetical protein FQN49_007196 [Arthroderma sp. PD_2]|nr:hypothetical protein FQN49_007196 [Arthroderma sp. PD_2]